MSAYSDWKYGCISDSEYRHDCWAEDMRDRSVGCSEDVESEEDDGY